MDARVAWLTFHAWSWMHPVRTASGAGGVQETTRRAAPPPLSPVLPPGLGVAARLGLDLGVPADLPFGGRRQV